VRSAQEQRDIYRKKKKEAIDSLQQPPAERVLCFVADFAQNMNIPNFASKQPGATYYYAPMSAYVFGVVDASQDRLAAYVYTEDQVKKGGNNVASLLMLHLQRSGIFDQASTDSPFKELNIVMDNCG
jgi:hypothetical protein